jgi:Skp family chaperone for outer membrane proteins
MKQTLRLVVTLLITGMFAVAAAQGLPGATVKKDEGAAKDAPKREAGKDNWRERCRKDPQECENKKAEMQKKREECRANPDQCKAERAAKREAHCKDKPQECAEARKKIDLRYFYV